MDVIFPTAVVVKVSKGVQLAMIHDYQISNSFTFTECVSDYTEFFTFICYFKTYFYDEEIFHNFATARWVEFKQNWKNFQWDLCGMIEHASEHVSMAFNLGFQTKYVLNLWYMLCHLSKVLLKVFSILFKFR